MLAKDGDYFPVKYQKIVMEKIHLFDLHHVESGWDFNFLFLMLVSFSFIYLFFLKPKFYTTSKTSVVKYISLRIILNSTVG